MPKKSKLQNFRDVSERNKEQRVLENRRLFTTGKQPFISTSKLISEADKTIKKG